jgi:hypothetical protein
MKNSKKVEFLFIASIFFIGLSVMFYNKAILFNKIQDSVIEKHERENDSLRQSIKEREIRLMLLSIELDSVLNKVDSLEKVKSKIIVKYEKNIPVITNASANDDALWLKSKLEDIRKK